MKISDFRLAEYFIRKYCATKQVGFVDIEIEFTQELHSKLENGRLLLANTDSFGKTVFNIASTYVNNINEITQSESSNDDIQSFFNTILAVVRDMTYGSSSYATLKKDAETELNRQPLVFLLMRDIVCPSFNRPIKNIHIKAMKSPYVDGAKWLTTNSVVASDYSGFPLMMLNMDVENEAYRQAFLFVETIKAHDLDPLRIIHALYTKEELRKPFMGLLRLSLVETDAVNDFLMIVSALTQYSGEKMLDKTSWTLNPIKTSQLGGGGMGGAGSAGAQTWWYLGLIEKLLEPARGPDWSRYEELQNQTKDLWNKIEQEKVKRGLDPLPMEILLRLQSEEYKQDPYLTIQGLLADNRVW